MAELTAANRCFILIEKIERDGTGSRGCLYHPRFVYKGSIPPAPALRTGKALYIDAAAAKHCIGLLPQFLGDKDGHRLAAPVPERNPVPFGEKLLLLGVQVNDLNVSTGLAALVL